MNPTLLLKKYYGWLLVLFVSCALVYANLNLYVDLNGFDLHYENGGREAVSLPLSRESEHDGGRYELHGRITFGWSASKTLRIIPDDRVESMVINGEQVDLSEIPEEQLSDWENGFTLDVGPYVTTGENSIAITFTDGGGEGLMGMKISSLYGGRVLAISMLWLALALIVGIFKTGAACKVPKLHSALYCLVFLGAVLRLWWIYAYNPTEHVGSDAQRHWEQGTDTLRSDLMSNADPIMYQIYIGILEKLTLAMPEMITFYTFILAFVGTWFWYRFFRELQSNKTIALAGWAGIALLPSWITIYTYYMQETLLLPLLGGALWMTWRARRKATVESFIWMTALWIMAGLTRGIAVPLAAVCCTAIWLTQEQKLKKALLAGALMLFVMGPLTYRSYQTVHHFAPHGMGHVASIYARSGKKEIVLDIKNTGVYGFGSPSTGARPFYPFSDWETRRQGTYYVNVDLEKGREDWDKAYADVDMSWPEDLWILKENLIFLFFGTSWPDDNDTRILDLIGIHMRWLWVPAFLGAIVWTVMMRRRLRKQWLLPSLILAWFIVQGLLVISFNEGRYRKPFEGLIIAQFMLLAAVRRGEVRAGQPYNWGFDYNRWLERIRPAAGLGPGLPAATAEAAEPAGTPASGEQPASETPGDYRYKSALRQRDALE